MDGFGDHPPHIHRDIIRDLRHPMINVIKSLTIHKVFHIQRRQTGQMVALQLAIVIKQTSYRRGIFFPRLIAVHQHVPLDPHPAGKLDQWLQAGLGEFDHLNPFSIKMMTALPGQFVDNPGFRLSLHQQPAAGEER